MNKMSLTKDLNEQNIIILAQGFKPSSFNQLWFLKNKIITDESEFSSDSIITPDIAEIIFKEFSLIVTPEQMLFVVKDELVFDNYVRNILIPIINKTEDVLYSAIGFNSAWLVSDLSIPFPEFNKTFLRKEISKNPLYNFFNGVDARFGTYMSKEFLDSRLKLDIKPVLVSREKPQNNSEYLYFRFNYHRDLDNENRHKQLIDVLSTWNIYSKEVTNIISSICNGSM